MFVCQNQPCGARWAPDEVEIHNEGQGPIFRCPLCGARNYLQASKGRGGAITYKQVSREQAGVGKAGNDKAGADKAGAGKAGNDKAGAGKSRGAQRRRG
ncbi:hypothetical protein [Cupriavidus sp. BIS7]|uniref:hypothetical protein n=1 Tax=Cupriavidus sp. BIS7 TaxID=1217718 RepID=UPI0003056D9F|nr:hypothetical protein [Cupriavidus sp. BIS7]